MNKTIINTKNAPKAIGPYSQAVVSNGFIFTSGQIPINPHTGELEKSDIKKAAAQVFENLKAVLSEAGAELDDVVKATVFIKDLNDFQAVNEVYATYFTNGFPARSCVQASKLPLDALVEIEVVAAVK